MNVKTLQIPATTSASLRVAVISDLHISNAEAAFLRLDSLVAAVVQSAPDLVLLLGDYTQHPDEIPNIGQHRAEVAKRLSPLSVIPTLAVLGNYETWSNAGAWQRALSAQSITVLQNEVQTVVTEAGRVCVRGLGDAFTKQLRYVDFPEDCGDSVKLTITHDPAGAFYPGVSGLIIAGHTHCGQLRIPGYGPIWVPSQAPRGATCGLYKDAYRTLWVSAGVGTSILPIRLGAQAQWDLLTISGDGSN